MTQTEELLFKTFVGWMDNLQIFRGSMPAMLVRWSTCAGIRNLNLTESSLKWKTISYLNLCICSELTGYIIWNMEHFDTSFKMIPGSVTCVVWQQ